MPVDEDRILEEASNDPEVAPALNDLLNLEELRDHPGWKYQSERFRGFKRGVMLALSRRLMAGVKIDPEQISFERGYAAGIEDVFRWPERLEKDLERAAEKAWERAEERLSEEDGERPYE